MNLPAWKSRIFKNMAPHIVAIQLQTLVFCIFMLSLCKTGLLYWKRQHIIHIVPVFCLWFPHKKLLCFTGWVFWFWFFLLEEKGKIDSNTFCLFNKYFDSWVPESSAGKGGVEASLAVVLGCRCSAGWVGALVASALLEQEPPTSRYSENVFCDHESHLFELSWLLS